MRQIPNFPNYFITKEGKVWSSPKSTSNKKGKFLTSWLEGGGKYPTVSLCKDGKLYKKFIHHLVLETFIGPRPNGMECRHLDGNPSNNKLENLCWGTHRENMKDRIKHKTQVDNSGEKHGMAKLKESDVRMIIYMYRTGEFTQQEIAEIYNVDPRSVSSIVNKRTWKHIWSENVNSVDMFVKALK